MLFWGLVVRIKGNLKYMVINVFVDIVSVESIKELHKRKMSQNKLIRLTTTLYNMPYACVWWLTPLVSGILHNLQGSGVLV
jgi:hypothetical protein